MAPRALRPAAAALGRSPAFRSAAALVDRAGPSRPHTLGVLTYHRVAPLGGSPWLHPGLLSATPEGFADQMAFVSARYQVVSLEDVLDARRRGARLPCRSVLLTFDDAYADFADHAWPVLRRLGLPVTLFVPTAFPGDPDRQFWWDRLHQAFATTRWRQLLPTAAGPLPMATPEDRRRSGARLRSHLKSIPHTTLEAEVDRLVELLEPRPAPSGNVLDWSDLSRLAGEGVVLGAHSRTHALLDRVSPARLRDEVLGSAGDLQRATGRAPSAFAYPAGAHNAEVVTAVEEAGLLLSFTTRQGLNDLRQHAWLRLRRVNVSLAATPPVLQLRLLPALAGLHGA